MMATCHDRLYGVGFRPDSCRRSFMNITADGEHQVFTTDQDPEDAVVDVAWTNYH